MEGRDGVLDDRVRAAVRFEQRNLTEDDVAFWNQPPFDVIFCRNVLMYLTPASAKAVVARLWRALAPGGYLFLGHAETLRGLSSDFHLCHTHGTFYYQRKSEGAVTSRPFPRRNSRRASAPSCWSRRWRPPIPG